MQSLNQSATICTFAEINQTFIRRKKYNDPSHPENDINVILVVSYYVMKDFVVMDYWNKRQDRSLKFIDWRALS